MKQYLSINFPFLHQLRLIFLIALCFLGFTLSAQNVGIGTNAPMRKLSVVGSVMIDQNNQATGLLDSAALVFGTTGVGITAKKTPGPGQAGLSLWTNGFERFNIGANGNIGFGGPYSISYKYRLYGGDMMSDGSIISAEGLVGIGNSAIGGSADNSFKFRVYENTLLNTLQTESGVTVGGTYDPAYKLRVVGGDTRFGGDMHATGNVAFGTTPDAVYRLRVHDGHTFLGGNLRTTGNTALGGTIDDAYRLRVWDGNSRFGGNVLVTGATTTTDLTVENDLTIGGKGSVKSNGPSSLRIGFDQKSVSALIPGNDGISVVANITDFAGGDDDVRVLVSHVDFLNSNAMLSNNVHILVINVDAAANTATIKIRNLGNNDAYFSAVIYLATIAKD